MKKYIFLFSFFLCIPSFVSATEDCSTYTSQITKLQSEILDLNYQYNHVAENIQLQSSWYETTKNFLDSKIRFEQNKIAVQISDKNIEIERQKIKYNTCLQSNYQEELTNYNQAIARQAQNAIDIKKTQEQDAYYAQKAKEDTIKLQLQIETDKKKQQADSIKNARIAKIAENKKRIEEMRKKTKERLAQKKLK